MEKELCFKINSQELFLDQVLVEYNNIPVYYICKNDNEAYYIVLCTDIDEEKYVIVNIQIEDIINLLKQRLTMRDIILEKKTYWDIVAKENIDEDVCKQYDINNIDIEDMPSKESYFLITSQQHKKYLNELESIIQSNDDEWCIISDISITSLNELDVDISDHNIRINDYTIIKSTSEPIKVRIEQTKTNAENVSFPEEDIKSCIITQSDSIQQNNLLEINSELIA